MAVPDLSGRRVGEFELRELLGAGAFATVWRARQLRLGRDVAVKVLDPALARSPEAARRFEREGRAAAGLDHPGVVPVLAAGEDDGLVYLAMRLVEGETLEQRLERQGPLGLDETVAVLRPVADALDHVHAAGLVHRDVKPSNVLLEGDDVWLTDFGIAATAREIGRYTTGAIGTAAYMAPEQAAGEVDLDHRVDVYALGCVAYTCLAGRPPFGDGDLVATMYAHVHEPVPTTGDDAVDGALAGALAKEPAHRYANASDVVVALAHAAGHDVAAPDRAAVPPATPSPRRAVAVAVAGAGVVAGALVMALSLASGGGDGGPGPGGEDGAEASPTTSEATVPAAVPVTGGAVTVAADVDLPSLNPHTDVAAEPLISTLVLPTLARVGEDLTVEPWLAGAPTLVSEDPQVVEWTLRDDAVWDDGSPITTTDVARTLAYLRDPAAEAAGTFLYDRIADLEIVDGRTFRVEFVQPVAAYPLLFSTTHPVLQAAALDAHVARTGSVAGFLADELDFSGGPLRVREAGDGILELERNPAWWGQGPALDAVTVQFDASADDAVGALAAGDVDVAYLQAPRLSDLRAAQDVAGVTVTAGTAELVRRLDMNTRTPPLDDPRVRQAIALAVDRADVVAGQVEAVTGVPEQPLQSLFRVPAEPGYREPFARYGHDPASARDLLDEAGWTRTDGAGARTRDGQPLNLTLHITTDRTDAAVATLLQDQLADVGVILTVEPEPAQTYRQRQVTGDFQLLLAFQVPNADPTVHALTWSGQRCPTSVPGCDAATGWNFTGYDAGEVTELLEATHAEFDPDARAALFDQAEQLVAKDVPSLPLYVQPAFVAHRDDLDGLDLATYRGGPLVGLDRWTYVGTPDDGSAGSGDR